jgi:hypothetical protein
MEVNWDASKFVIVDNRGVNSDEPAPKVAHGQKNTSDMLSNLDEDVVKDSQVLPTSVPCFSVNYCLSLFFYIMLT